jgi:GTPase SAR1 family protein
MTNQSQSQNLIQPAVKIQQVKQELLNLKNNLLPFSNIFQTIDFQIYKNILQDLKNIDESISQLSSPTIHLSTIGTTSSGKSTLVNAIIGELIAPMDADEMSAGVLTIHHSKDNEDWKLNNGNENINSSVKIYQHLTRIMGDEIRRRRDQLPYENKSFKVTGPLFPLSENHEFLNAFCDDSLFNKSTFFINLDIFDLPGLRTINDPANIEIIRNYIKKSLTIVCIDRQQLFEREKRNELLKEIKTIMEDLGGSTVLMYFILNKCDIPNPGGKSIAEHQEELQIEIQKYLQTEKINIIPFSAKIYLFAARSVVAYNNGNFNMSQEIMTHSFKDGGVRSQIKELIMKDKPINQSDPSFEIWKNRYRRFTSIENKIDLDENLDQSDIRLFTHDLLAASGHQDFWERLILQIKNNLDTILIYPSVNQTLLQLDLSIQQQEAYIKTQQIQTIQQLDDEIKNIGNFKDWSKRTADDINFQYVSNFENLILVLNNKNDVTSYQSSLENIFKNINLRKKAPNLYKLHEWTGELITKILIPKVLDPITSVLLGHQTIADWTYSVSKEFDFIDEIRNLAKSLEQMKDHGYSSIAAKGESVKLRIHGNEKRVNSYKELIRCQAQMYLAARRLMTKIAEQVFQKKCYVVNDEFSELTTHMNSQIWESLAMESKKRFGNSIIGQIMSKNIKISSDLNIYISEEVIKIPEPNLGQTITNREQVGTTHKDPNASCFKGKEMTVYGNVDYYETVIPSAAQINDQLTVGVQQAREDFYQRLIQYLTQNHIQKSMDQIKSEIIRLIDVVARGLEVKKLDLEKNANQKISYWEEINMQLNNIKLNITFIKELSGYAENKR